MHNKIVIGLTKKQSIKNYNINLNISRLTSKTLSMPASVPPAASGRPLPHPCHKSLSTSIASQPCFHSIRGTDNFNSAPGRQCFCQHYPARRARPQRQAPSSGSAVGAIIWPATHSPNAKLRPAELRSATLTLPAVPPPLQHAPAALSPQPTAPGPTAFRSASESRGAGAAVEEVESRHRPQPCLHQEEG